MKKRKWKFDGTVHQLFVDFEKTYDSVRRDIVQYFRSILHKRDEAKEEDLGKKSKSDSWSPCWNSPVLVY